MLTRVITKCVQTNEKKVQSTYYLFSRQLISYAVDIVLKRIRWYLSRKQNLSNGDSEIFHGFLNA